MEKRVILQQRDKEMFLAIWYDTTLSLDQLTVVYFENHRDYAKKRLSVLKRAGHLTARRFQNDDGVRTSGYYVTTRGCRAVGIEIQESANKQVIKGLTKIKTEIAEIHIRLRNTRWNWSNSRDIKARYNLNRGAKVDGLLETANYRYRVYLVGKNPLKKTINKIKLELALYSSILPGAIIFYKSRETAHMFEDEGITINNLLMLEYPFGIGILAAIDSPDILMKLYQHMLGPHPVLSGNNKAFADYLTEINGRQYYITQLLTHDLKRKYFLKKFAGDVAALEDRGVKVLTIDSQVEDFKDQFQSYPHFEFVGVPREWFVTK